METRPPKWAADLLARLCSPQHREEIQGDLHEAFMTRCQERGTRYASMMFVLDVLRSISFSVRDHGRLSWLQPAMVMNFLLIGYRNLLRHKVFSLLNISGLAIGMAACFLIAQYVLFERSYDSFHSKRDRIYRVTSEQITSQSRTQSATNHPGTGPVLKLEFPEVVEAARLLHQSIFMGETATWSATAGNGQERAFNESNVYCADPSFLRMFDFPFVSGDPATALKDPSGIVISEHEAIKYFGSNDALGKTLVLDGWKAFKVTGIFKDIPENSHVHFDMLVSYFLLEWSLEELKWEGQWKWCEFFTYVELAPHVDPQKLESRFDDLIARYSGDITQHFHLQPLTDIHLRSPDLSQEREIHGNERSVYFLVIIAAMILVIAWINYINLSTAKSIERAREIGVRKCAGASRLALTAQFLLESVLTNLVAVVLAFLLVTLTLPYFDMVTGRDTRPSVLDLPLFHESGFWISGVAIFFAGSLLSGLYPAFVMSSFRVAMVIKGKLSGSRSGILLRKTLVSFQFAISVALVAGTVMVYRQLAFMRSADPGFAMDQLVILKTPRVGDSTLENRVRTFRAEILRNPRIVSIGQTSDIPGRPITARNDMRRMEDSRQDQLMYYQLFVDKEFLDTYGLTLLAGRNFVDGEVLTEMTHGNPVMPIIVNEATTRALRFESPDQATGQLIYYGLGATYFVGKIVGVVRNHHQRTLHEKFDPIIFFPPPQYSVDYLTVKVRVEDPDASIQFIRKEFSKTFPGSAFDYFFLDDFINRQYAGDRQFGYVFGLFSALALLVAGLGLFGLSTFMIIQRTKEIAVRKVLGATIQQLIALFSGDFMKLIILANVIALPLSWWAVDRWLERFAFHTPVTWLMFVLPAAILAVITVGTIAAQTFRTGFVNPVKALKGE